MKSLKNFELKRGHALLVIALAMVTTLLLHLPHMQKDLMGVHVWRQAQTQNTINSFFEEDMNIFHPRQNVRGGSDGIYRMEFPLMQWSIAALYFITGEHIAVTRWVMMFFYLLSIAGFAFTCYHAFKSWLAAAIGAWVFCFSPEIFYYGINPLPDVLALCCCSWGIGWFLKYEHDQRNRSLYLCGIWLCLSALIKLPFILFFAIPFSYLLFVKKQAFKARSFQKTTVPLVLCVLPVLAWYTMVIGGWQGNGIVTGVFQSDTSMAVLAGYVMHHLLSTFPELYVNYAALPLCLFGIYQLYKTVVNKSKLLPFVITFALVFLYFLFEINMIEKVHDYYLFPFYPFIVLMSTWGALQLTRWGKLAVSFVLVCLLAMPITAYLRRANSWEPSKPGFNKDLLIYKDQLRKAVPDDALCVAGNDPAQHVFLYYIHKKGWIFDSDNYDAFKLQNAIREGAVYLYSDSRFIEEDSSARLLLQEKIASFGSINIYRLKK